MSSAAFAERADTELDSNRNQLSPDSYEGPQLAPPSYITMSSLATALRAATETGSKYNFGSHRSRLFHDSHEEMAAYARPLSQPAPPCITMSSPAFFDIVLRANAEIGSKYNFDSHQTHQPPTP